MTHFIFDLDRTLVDTTEIKDYMRTGQGRDYATNNINQIQTAVYDDGIIDLIATLHRHGNVSVLTNSPAQYARNVLNKHGFPQTIPVYGSANKPNTNVLRRLLTEQNTNPNNTLFIDDSAKGILTAHELGMCSLGVCWGDDSKNQLKQAEATRVIRKPESLEKMIIKFGKGAIEYVPRTNPEKLIYLPNELYAEEGPEVTFFNLRNYIPVYHGTRDPFSSEILNFKDSKDFTLEELEAGKRVTFFHAGSFVVKEQYGAIVEGMIQRLTDFIHSDDFKNQFEGTETWLIAAPNSNPEFCYHFDANLFILEKARTKTKDLEPVKLRRLVKRAYPRKNKQNIEHYRTIGIDNFIEKQPENIIIFDDVRTTGSQIRSIAKILSHAGYDANFFGLSLGRTT